MSDWRDEFEGNTDFWLIQNSEGNVRVAYDKPPLFACGPSIHVVRASERDELRAEVERLKAQCERLAAALQLVHDNRCLGAFVGARIVKALAEYNKEKK